MIRALKLKRTPAGASRGAEVKEPSGKGIPEPLSETLSLARSVAWFALS
jgi:hypothetical protein